MPRPSEGEVELLRKPVDGRMSFFCLEAGSISSRSTGTPSETKKSRRMRERTQLGGCKGGGATSCDHRERLRSVRKIEGFSSTEDDGKATEFWVVGNTSSKYGSVAVMKLSKELSPLKSSTGFNKIQYQLCLSQNRAMGTCCHVRGWINPMIRPTYKWRYG